MAVLNSSLILSMVDKVSGPARRIDQNLDNLRRQQMRSQEMFDHHRNAMLGTAAAAYVMVRALSAPVQASIEFSSQLEDIRQKADMSTEAIEKLGRASRDIGLDTAQGAGTITGAIDSMVGSGAVTPDQAVEISTPLGKASTAYGADPTELASATSAIVLQMDVAADKMEHVYDIMAVGGKEGAFEFKNMAQEFATVLSLANSLGITGEEGVASIVAWLQVARQGAATGAEAATRLNDFMGKVQSEDAKKNFAEFGVDISAELKRALEAGVDPIEHVVGIINKLLDGDKARIGELFNDKEVRLFLLQAMSGLEEYERIRDASLAADGTVEKDFQDRLLTPAGAIARFEASIENLNIAIGNSLVPALADFARSVTPMIDGVAAFVDANGELVKAVVEITAALIGLRLLGAAGGMLGALTGMNFGGPNAGQNNKPGIPGAPSGATPSAGGTNPLQNYMWLAPIIADQIGTAIWDGIHGAGATAANKEVADGAWERTAERLTTMWNSNRYEDVTESDNPGERAMLDQMAALRSDIAKLESANLPVPPVELHFMKADLQSLEDEAAAAGFDVGASLQAGIAGQSGAVAAEMATVMSRLRIMAAAGVNIPMRVNGPAVSPVVTRAQIAGARANGGPVRGGSTYEINERGTEYFTPGVDGFVHKAGSFQPPGLPSFGGKAGSGGGGPTVVNITGDINLSNPTNADPRTISRMMADEVGNRLRASHSNGAM